MYEVSSVIVFLLYILIKLWPLWGATFLSDSYTMNCMRCCDQNAIISSKTYFSNIIYGHFYSYVFYVFFHLQLPSLFSFPFVLENAIRSVLKLTEIIFCFSELQWPCLTSSMDKPHPAKPDLHTGLSRSRTGNWKVLWAQRLVSEQLQKLT